MRGAAVGEEMVRRKRGKAKERRGEERKGKERKEWMNKGERRVQGRRGGGWRRKGRNGGTGERNVSGSAEENEKLKRNGEGHGEKREYF